MENISNNLSDSTIEVNSEKEMKFSSKISLYNNERRVRIYSYLVLSTFAGFMLGWYFKLPNNILLIQLGKCDSLFRKNLVLDFYKNKSTFFSTVFFSFNWVVFLLSTLICFLLLLFFNDAKFRQYLFDKITFREEKKSNIPIANQDSESIDVKKTFRNQKLVFRKINLNLSIIPYIILIIFFSFISIGFIKVSYDALIDKESFICILFLVLSLGSMVLVHYIYRDYKSTKK